MTSIRGTGQGVVTTPSVAYLFRVRFVETPIFTEDVERELSLEEYRQLQLALLFRPTQGDLIRGSGGLRKLRWAAQAWGSGADYEPFIFGMQSPKHSIC